MMWQWYLLHRHIWHLPTSMIGESICVGGCFFNVLACLTQQYVMEMYGTEDNPRDMFAILKDNDR